MINLIPPKGHKVVKYEYYFRVSSTLGFLFTAVFLLLTIALIPTYVLVDAQINAFKLEENLKNNEDEIFKSIDHEVRITKEMIAQFRRIPDNIYASVAITEITEISPKSIIFNNFIIVSSKGIVDSIQIQGRAPTREALAQLKNIIESSDMFERAEIPIADLARDVDVPFAITVTLNKE